MRLTTYTEILHHVSPLILSDEYEGSCPCATIRGDNFLVEVHCWRTSCGNDNHPYSCIHVSGSLPESTLQKIAEHVRDNNGWTDHTDWDISVTHHKLKEENQVHMP